jgi:hypothetical protein
MVKSPPSKRILRVRVPARTQLRSGEGTDSPTYPAPTQQIFRTGGVRALVSNSVDDSERLLLRDLGVRCAESSSGRSTGLKERLPSGVVGAVDPSKATCSSASTNVVDKGIISDGGGTTWSKTRVRRQTEPATGWYGDGEDRPVTGRRVPGVFKGERGNLRNPRSWTDRLWS